jgi:hypothetical protein
MSHRDDENRAGVPVIATITIEEIKQSLIVIGKGNCTLPRRTATLIICEYGVFRVQLSYHSDDCSHLGTTLFCDQKLVIVMTHFCSRHINSHHEKDAN